MSTYPHEMSGANRISHRSQFRVRWLTAIAASASALALTFGGLGAAHAAPDLTPETQPDATAVAFSLDRNYALAKGRWPRANSVRLFNNSMDPGQITVTDSDGAVVLTKKAKAGGQTYIDFPKPTKMLTRYTITATQADGASISFPFAVVNTGTDHYHWPNVDKCTTITWTYDNSKAPKKGRGLRKDLAKAMRTITKHTGVQFQQAGSPSGADLTFRWGKLPRRHIADAGSDDVRFSRTHRAARDSNAGFKAGGRAWVAVHEILHVMGMEHTSEPGSIMNAQIGSQKRFTAADKALMTAFYKVPQCSRETATDV